MTISYIFVAGKAMEIMSQCENCVNYYFDDESEEYCCDINLDEDEMMRFLTTPNYHCPYFRLDDEYGVVRKQN